MSFRIKLNLCKFFSDHRQSVFVNIDLNWENVKSLEDHIVKLFRLKHSIYLTTKDGTLIPSLEKISVVLPTDTLIVASRRKHESEQTIITPTKNQENMELSNILDSSQIKKKRKRKRQKKNEEVKKCIDPPIAHVASFQTANDEISTKKLKSHIRFDHSPVRITEDLLPRRVVRAISEQPVCIVPDFKGNNCTNIELNMEIAEGGFEEIKINGSLELTNGEITSESSLETIRKNCESLNLPTLTEIPNVNDVVLFKYLRMGDNYVPEISEFLIGLIESIDNENNNLKIYILAGNEKLTIPDGKFSMPDEEEQDNNSLLLNWNELIEPKLVKID